VRHFLTKGHWSPDVLRACRLEVPRPTPGETPFILCIDETGDCKKGRTTNSVASQYIGTMHTLANGIVTVNAYREK
jgi:SRSO17 transposase